MNHSRIFLFFPFLLMLSSCAKKPKKVVVDHNTHIDAELALDEYASSAERIHAKEFARRLYAEHEASEVNRDTAQALAREDLIALVEAKFADVPIPMGCKPMKEYFTSELLHSREVVFGYSSDVSSEELANFYEVEMGSFGWHQQALFSGSEQLLVFEKNNQLCIVLIRKYEGWFYERPHTQLLLFVSER